MVELCLEPFTTSSLAWGKAQAASHESQSLMVSRLCLLLRVQETRRKAVLCMLADLHHSKVPIDVVLFHLHAFT